jgi:hypothetical protein
MGLMLLASYMAEQKFANDSYHLFYQKNSLIFSGHC